MHDPATIAQFCVGPATLNGVMPGVHNQAARRAFSQDFSITECDSSVSYWGATTICIQVADGPGLPQTAGCTLRRRAHGLGGPGEDREAGTRLSARTCLDQGFYLHRQGPAGVSSQIMSAAVQGGSSGPIEPTAGISALSTETICGPKLRPPQRAPPRSRHKGLVSLQVSGGGGGI